MKKKMVWLGMAVVALLAAGGSAFAQEGGTKEVTDVLDRTITLPEDVEKVAQELLDGYCQETGIETTYLVTRAGEGARVLYQA